MAKARKEEEMTVGLREGIGEAEVTSGNRVLGDVTLSDPYALASVFTQTHIRTHISLTDT